VLQEALDETIRTVSQLRQATGLECLGVIPQSKSLSCRPNRQWRRTSRNHALQGHMLVPSAFRQAAVNSDSGMAIAVHGVRVAAARLASRGREVRVIACVSVLGGEGASTFAANLAFALAADGQRTVLLDWNTPHPWLTKVLAPGINSGIHDLIARDMSFADVALTDTAIPLSFVGQSPSTRNLSTPGIGKIRTMTASMRDRHDFVVLNLPPMQGGAAAVMLSELIDGFVLVTRWGGTPAHLLSEALGRTAAMDALFLGTILNGSDPKRMQLYPRDLIQPLGAANEPLIANLV